MTKISIVLAYNTQLELTKQCLDNLGLVMHYEPEYEYEVIVVNGGNETDIEHELITNLVHLDTNQGFTYTLNRGLEQISKDSDYVLFTSNDCFPITIPFFKPLLEAFNKEGVGVVSPIPDRPKIESYKAYLQKEDDRYYYYNFFPTITWLFKREFIDRVGLLDEGYTGTGMYADNDWSLRATKVYGLNSILVDKQVQLHHKLSQESGQFDIKGDMNRGRDYYLNKWG